MNLPEKRSSRLTRVRVHLKGLDSRAERTALLVCFYAAPRDPELIKEIEDELGKVTRASRALKKLHVHLAKVRKNLECTLGDVMESWTETIRSAHTPPGSSPLLPIPELAGLDKYYLLKGIPDPSEPIGEFVKLWPQIEALAKREANFLWTCTLEMRRLLKGRVRHSWQNGRLEFVLHQLFIQHFTGTWLDKKIEKQIELISRELDRRWRDIDKERGGCQGVRQAILRVERNKKYKQQCESFLKSQLARPAK